MKISNSFHFYNGANITIRKILEKKESLDENLTYFLFTLNKSEAKVKASIKTKNEFLIKPNSILYYVNENAVGHIL